MTGFTTPLPRTPITDGAGNVSPEWWRFFVQIQKVIGAPSSPFDDATLMASGHSPLAAPVDADFPFSAPVAPQEEAAPYNGSSPVLSALVALLDDVPGTYAPIASPAFTGTASFGGPARLKGYTVATLPAGTQGDTAFVTDALAPAFLAAVVGGGAIVTTVFYNGAAWVAQ